MKQVIPEKLDVDWDKFYEWCTSRASEKTCRDRLNYARKPLDPGNDHSVKAWRLLLQFLGRPIPDFLKIKRSGVDLNIPSDDDIKRTLDILCWKNALLCMYYKLLIESGARLSEIALMVSEYDIYKDKYYNNGDFHVYALNVQRGTKRSFYIFHITRVKWNDWSAQHVSRLARKYDIVRPKYVRKWVATKLASLGFDSSLIDFIQGRTPSSILSKHYMNLYALALQHYPRYAAWLRSNVYSRLNGG